MVTFIFVILTYFWKLPAGVLIYWVVSNLAGIIQQVYANTEFAIEQYKKVINLVGNKRRR